MGRWSFEYASTINKFWLAMRDRAMLLLATQTAFRGDNTRHLLFSDLYMVLAPNVHAGPDKFVEVLRRIPRKEYILKMQSFVTQTYDKRDSSEHLLPLLHPFQLLMRVW